MRAQIFAKSSKKKTSAAAPRDRALDYHKLSGEQGKPSSSSLSSKKVVGTGYSKLAGDGASSGSFDEEPVKLTTKNLTSPTATMDAEIPDYYQNPTVVGLQAATSLESNDEKAMDEIETLLSDSNL